MDKEIELPKEVGSCTGTEIGYTVEARYNFHTPKVIANQIFDNRWRVVRFVKGDIGVPDGKDDCLFDRAYKHGYLPYASAQALRWWLHAIAIEKGWSGGLCLETRLVEHEIAYTEKQTVVKYYEHVGGDEGIRSSRFPEDK